MNAQLEKYEVRNRWTNAVQFTAEISTTPEMQPSIKLGLAVKWGLKNDADLGDANLGGANLRGADLRGANLRDANLRDANLRGAYLRDANLGDANLGGANLRGADLRGADLGGANLRDANLRDANLGDAYLRDANLRGADLGGANLRDANLRDANLRGAYLRDANLGGADLGGADLSGSDLSDCPVKIENIHQRVFEAASKDGALNMRVWHKGGNFCGTTHCRAGWVTHLAGEGGRALEFAFGTPAAAAMIYLASDPSLEKVPDFYCDNQTALKDMKRLAEAEVSA